MRVVRVYRAFIQNSFSVIEKKSIILEISHKRVCTDGANCRVLFFMFVPTPRTYGNDFNTITITCDYRTFAQSESSNRVKLRFDHACTLDYKRFSERSFSPLEKIKTYSTSTVEENRLNELALFNIHLEIIIKPE